jgi:branched-subunit amino acid transport protein AzlD
MPIQPATDKHRVTQRANVVSEVVAGAFKSLAQPAAIPVKIAQTIISTYSFFTNNLKTEEKVVQAIQATLSASQVALLIMLALDNEQCCDKSITFCQLSMIMELAYQGVLVSSYVMSEAIRNREEPQQLPDAVP